MKKISELTKHLDLVFWPGGHFGAFFINLMNASQLTLQDKKYFNRSDKNKEWAVVDYFSAYHYSERLKLHRTLVNQLVDIYGDDWEQHYYYILYQYTYRYFTLNQGDFPDESIRNLSKEDILNLADAPFLGVSSPLKFTKCHEEDYFYTNDNIPWNNKIAVVLPKNKRWIAEIMLWYKHTTPLHVVISDLRKKTSYNDDQILQKNFKTVNIYDVVFNKDLTSIYNIFPNFNFTKKEERLRNIVNKDSLDILHHYGLDHTYEVNNRWDLEKLIEKMMVYQQAQKIKPYSRSEQ
jgi:hypothetical protein